jgi:hypothetical protein
VHLVIASSFQRTNSVITVTDICWWEDATAAPFERPIVPLDSDICWLSIINNQNVLGTINLIFFFFEKLYIPNPHPL